MIIQNTTQYQVKRQIPRSSNAAPYFAFVIIMREYSDLPMKIHKSGKLQLYLLEQCLEFITGERIGHLQNFIRIFLKFYLYIVFYFS